MAHSYQAIYVHAVFSTRWRRKLISKERERRICKYLAGIAHHHGMKALAVGGSEDHVHLLLSLGSQIAVAKAINILKSNSSKWMRDDNPEFAWQEGYSAFSVSASSLDAVRAYIQHQEEHHRKRDFAAEYVALLKKHGVNYDPRWVLG